MSEPTLKRLEVKCENCGVMIPLDSEKMVIVCPNCRRKYERVPALTMKSILKFNRVGQSPLDYEITNDIIISRHSGRGYIEIISEIDNSVKVKTYVRNPCISREHARVKVKDEYTIYERKVIKSKRCFIQDLNSKHGTAINNMMLEPDELRELRHNDTIVLAPKSDFPLSISFQTKFP